MAQSELISDARYPIYLTLSGAILTFGSCVAELISCQVKCMYLGANQIDEIVTSAR